MPGVGYVSFSSYRHSPRLYFWGNFYSWYSTSPASFYYMDPDQPIRDSSMKNALMVEGERRYQEWVMVQRARQAMTYALEQGVTPQPPAQTQPLEAPHLEVAPQEAPHVPSTN
ncbi:MAG TPA: hypothetical protein DDW49_10935 [Deltaproteobacteria bacterium]|nr:hypothetical protein [Deltaproteobacteria bacterium]